MSTQIPESELLKPICVTCGTQYESSNPPTHCRICDDPRQYVPPSGQSWTTLKESISSGKFRNIIEPTPGADGRIYTILTQEKLGIGQRAHLIRTPQGNVVWDLVAYLDDESIDKIKELGGIDAIVISHPHFYTTYTTWSYAFGLIPVYLASEDEAWLSRPTSPVHELIAEPTREIIPESADSVMVVPSGLYSVDRQEGTVSFAFMWSYPNQIPLPPDAIHNIIEALSPFHFEIAHGGFPGQEVKRDAKRKLVRSAQIIISAMGGTQPGEQDKREFWKS